MGNTDEGIRLVLGVEGYIIRDNTITHNGDEGVYLSEDSSGDASFVSIVFRAAPQNGFVTATATDPGGNTSEFSACVGPMSFENDPVADAGPDQLALEGDFVMLFGRGSYDPDLGLLDYAWTQTGGPGVTLSDAAAVVPTFDAPVGGGVLTFTLMVTDDQGNDSPLDEVVVSINAAPVADAGEDQDVAYDSTVTLDGSASYDPTELPLEYRWRQTGGPTVTLSNPTDPIATFTAPSEMAVLAFTLHVTNTLELGHSDDIVVTVHQSPVADAGEDQIVPFGAEVTLDGSGSYDPDGETPLTYQWVQAGGTPVALDDDQSISPSFVAPGYVDNLIFELTVTDAFGLASVVDQVEIDVWYFIFVPMAEK